MGYVPPVPDVLNRSVKRLFVPVAALLGVMIGLGLLVTKVWRDKWPFTAEDAFNRELADGRTPDWSAVSGFVSLIGSTPVIIAVTALIATVLWVRTRRLREPLFLCVAVSAQALVFFFTTLVIDRRRPAVPKMDESPPTSSFPSGHTSAAVALYAGLALLLALTVRRTWLKALAWTLLLVPVAVALARLYRGMHHPSDVVASFLNGITCVVVASRAILDRTVRRGRSLAGTQQ